MQKLKNLRVLVTSILLVSCAAPAQIPNGTPTNYVTPGKAITCVTGNQTTTIYNLTSWKYTDGVWTFETDKATYTTNQFCIVSVQKA